MTNEEAINAINSLMDYYNDAYEDSYVGFDSEDNEALDMAIKALGKCIAKEPVQTHKRLINGLPDGYPMPLADKEVQDDE